MLCSVYARGLFLSAVMAGGCAGAPLCVPAQPSSSERQMNQPGTVVTLRWGKRPGVTRYRLQLAADAAFTNIVFDRVVRDHQQTISDLPPGKYFWRIAPIAASLGQFSSAGVIEVAATPRAPSDASTGSVPSAATTGGVDARRDVLRTSGGWYTAVGSVDKYISAHLRTRASAELIATTNDGRVIALDALTGRALWTQRLRANGSANFPLAIPTRNGIDDVLLLGDTATLLEGRTGKTLWQVDLSIVVSRATVTGENVFAIDSSLQKLIVIQSIDGKIISELRLPRRSVGATTFVRAGTSGVLIALDDGQLRLFDQSGKLIAEGDAGAPAATAPLLVKTPRGELILVGTSGGLTALDAENLRPLGRVSLSGDQPRGLLTARDLDNDGVADIVAFTNRGRVVVVKSDEGKIVWDAEARQAESAGLADINGDGVLDLLMMGKDDSAFSLSGRDGAIIWKSDLPSGVVANHAPSRSMRTPLVLLTPAGILFITADPTAGLRALEFHNRATTPR